MMIDDDHLHPPIDRAGRSVFLHAHHHRVLVAHFFACLTLPCLTFYSALFFPSFYQMSCHATLSIIERSGEASDGVVETTSCPSSVILLQRRPSTFLPSLPCCFCFSSSLLQLMATVPPSLSSTLRLVRPCLIPVGSCLSIVSFHG
jgi:hypothetical protein